MNKIERINSELRRQIALVIERELKHPKLNGLISVTIVEATHDLTSAKVGISIMGNTSSVSEIIEALNHSSGFIKRQLKAKMNIRMIPELTFNHDDNINYSAKISKIIDEVVKPSED